MQVYCTEQLLKMSLDSLDIIGAPAASQSCWVNKMHREAFNYLTLQESNDTLRIILVLLGLRHVGVSLTS